MTIDQFQEKIDNEYEKYIEYYSLYDKRTIMTYYAYSIAKARLIYEALYFFINAIRQNEYFDNSIIDKGIEVLRQIQETSNVDNPCRILNIIYECEMKYNEPMFYKYDNVAQIIIDHKYELLRSC